VSYCQVTPADPIDLAGNREPHWQISQGAGTDCGALIDQQAGAVSVRRPMAS